MHTKKATVTWTVYSFPLKMGAGTWIPADYERQADLIGILIGHVLWLDRCSYARGWGWKI